MPPGSVFMESVAGRRDMFPGSSIGMSPNLNFNMPGMNGMQGAMFQMVMDPLLQSMMGPGHLPFQFQPTSNLYDHYRKRLQYNQMQTTIQEASRSDQQVYTGMLRGLAATAGVTWTDERERAARSMAGDMTRISPMLAQMMPETFDRMHGTRGSAQVMAQNMFAGGRYRIDPVTGLTGYSGDSASTVTKEVYDRLYGPGASLAEMKGIGAGQAGKLFDEMGRRGFMPRAMSRDDQLRGVAEKSLRDKGIGDIEGQLGSAMDDLKNLASPQLEMKLRQFEASRIADRIKSMAGSISAMKDVFGEMGRPDAPMSELIEGLQVITQGGLASMPTSQVESLVRDASNIARRTGMGMDNMTMMMGAAANRADAMGLNRGFGVSAAMGSALFGQAYGNTVGGAPAWGRADQERIVAVDQQLRLNAANSGVANQLGATMRIGAEQGFASGSEGAALYEALQGGKTSYTFDGKTKSVYNAAGEWRSVMGRSGVDVNLASAYRSQTAYNQKTVSDNNLQDLTRKLQADLDIAPRIGQAYKQAGRAAGITDRGMLDKIGAAASEGLLSGLSPEDFQDPGKVAAYLAGQIGVDQKDAAKMSQLRKVADLGWGFGEQMVKINPRLKGYKTFDQMVLSNRRQISSAADAQREQAQMESRMQKALAGVGQGSPLSRLVDAVSGANTDTKFEDIVKEAIGWVPEGEVGERLKGTLDQMRQEMRSFSAANPEAIRKTATNTQNNIRTQQAQVLALKGQIKEIEEKGTPAQKAELPAMRAKLIESEKSLTTSQGTLTSLADRYGGGKVDNIFKGTPDELRKRIREQNIKKIGEIAPKLLKDAEAAGIETGKTVSSREAETIIQGFRDGRGASVAETGSLTSKIINDDRTLGMLGEGGLALVKGMEDRNSSMKELAEKHTGGNMGALLATDDQRKRARDAKQKVDALSARSKDLQKQLEAANAGGDQAKANDIKAQLDSVNKELREAIIELNQVGKEVGTSGEALASANVDAAVSQKVRNLKEGQSTDLKTIRDRLKAGKAGKLSGADKTAVDKERAGRNRTDAGVIDEVFKTLGVDVSKEDRAAITKDVMGGAGGEKIREMLPALEQLRGIAKERGITTDEDFQTYLKRGRARTSGSEEDILLHKIAGGRRGGGLAGINKDNNRRDHITDQLREFGPKVSPAGTETTSTGGSGPGGPMRIEGTLSVNLEGGTGRLSAMGRGGAL